MAVLKSGSKGNDVKKLQTDLNKLGAKPQLKVDGIFGPRTLEAVKAFQKKAKLKPDGQVGKLTLGAIRAGGALPEMGVPDYKAKLNRALVAKAHNLELAKMHSRFAKVVDVLEDEIKVKVPKAVKLLEGNQKHWDQIVKNSREIVAKQAEFEAIRLSHPDKAKKLAAECEKLRDQSGTIFKSQMQGNQKQADAIFKEARKKVREAAAKIDAELKALWENTNQKL
ncbi:peptidoglycan-binding protein [Seohaeicola saemankumensis]|nr:peptidoglycan-binding protein [Seohaeicola saemankumensis]MCA0872330.1 peptidoglycan-binding protein [Seohaeicola saemankumensis]